MSSRIAPDIIRGYFLSGLSSDQVIHIQRRPLGNPAFRGNREARGGISALENDRGTGTYRDDARYRTMLLDDSKTILSAQDARGGKELGVMRYVLYISLALAASAGIIILLIMR
jgi:hypothetical protein